MLGVSCFTGLNYDWQLYEDYLYKAAANNIELVFTSLHLPEANKEQVKVEFLKLCALCKKLNLKLIVDTSKNYFADFAWSSLPLHALRLDFGFSNAEIVELSKTLPFKIELNASVITAENLTELSNLDLKHSNIEVCHNYYPRVDTGISRALMKQRNAFFNQLGFSTLAFVPSFFKPRGPLYNGLPTLEEHRKMPLALAVQDLYLNQTDHVIIGDAMASQEELCLLKNLKKSILTLFFKPNHLNSTEQFLTEQPHTNRHDMGNDVIRSQQARLYCKNSIIEPHHLLERPAYSLCLDNKNYPRYQGELQIARFDRSRDDRVNVLGSMAYSKPLIDQMTGGEEFILKALKA